MERVTPNSVILSDGSELPADTIIFACVFACYRLKPFAQLLIAELVLEKSGTSCEASSVMQSLTKRQIYGVLMKKVTLNVVTVPPDNEVYVFSHLDFKRHLTRRQLWFAVGDFSIARFYSKTLVWLYLYIE